MRLASMPLFSGPSQTYSLNQSQAAHFTQAKIHVGRSQDAYTPRFAGQDSREPKKVMLRNGAQVEHRIVISTTLLLKSLVDSEYGLDGVQALIDLAEKLDDPSAKIAPESEKILKDLSLMQPDGSFHEATKAVLRSSLTGKGLDTKIVNPRQEPEKPE